MPNTQSGEFKFTVKESSDGTPWIALEPLHASIPMLKDSLLGFELTANTNYDQAKEVARYMNEHLSKLTLTIF